MAKKSRKSNQRKHGNANGGSVGQTSQWNLRQVVPVFVPPSVQVGRNYFIQMIAGVDGFRVEVLGDGTLAPVGSSYGGLYGEATGQFQKLAGLWSTYKIEGVKARFTPTSTFQLGSLSPSLSIVDVLGGSDEKDFPNSIGWYSRSKSLIIHTAYKEINRNVNYANWLVQCVNKPFLRTDLGGAREQYESDDIIRLPGIQMGFLFNPSQNVAASSSGYLLGFLDVNAFFSFRGRRLDEDAVAYAPPQKSIPKTLDSDTKTLLFTPNVKDLSVDESEDPSKKETKIENLSLSTIISALKANKV